MSDLFNVTGAYDKPSYSGGDTITITISGNDIQTITTQSQVGPVTIPVVAADGATSTVVMPAEQATIITATPQSVVIDTSLPIVDTSPAPRTWTIAGNKLSISAVA